MVEPSLLLKVRCENQNEDMKRTLRKQTASNKCHGKKNTLIFKAGMILDIS